MLESSGVHVFIHDIEQNRFYNRGIFRGIRIYRLSKITTLYRDWLRSLNLEKCFLISCIEKKGGFEDIHCIAQNAALFVALL